MDNTLKIIIVIGLVLFLAVAAIVAVFVVMPLFLLSTNMSSVEKCLVTPQGFTCGNSNPAVTSKGGNLMADITLKNGFSNTIRISRVLCIAGYEPSNMNPFNGKGEITSMEVSPGASYKGISIPCHDISGALAQDTPGKPFTGVVIFNYQLDDDISGFPPRKAIMSISTTVK